MTSAPVPRPKVSVCIPAYNAQATIAATLASVLGQTLGDLEVIVLDDASPDDTVAQATAAAAHDPRVRIEVNAANLGPTANWNKVVALASAPYVKVLCSDDLIYPTCLEQQAAVLDADGDGRVGLVAARRDIIDGDGRVVIARRGLAGMRGRVPGLDALANMVRSGTTPFGEPSVVLFRAAALQAVTVPGGDGPFRDHYGTLVDVDVYARVLARYDAYAIDDTLAAFRLLPGSWSDRSHRRQGANARRLFRDLGADPSYHLSRFTVAQGVARTFLLQRARKLAFAFAAARVRRAEEAFARRNSTGR